MKQEAYSCFYLLFQDDGYNKKLERALKKKIIVMHLIAGKNQADPVWNFFISMQNFPTT